MRRIKKKDSGEWANGGFSTYVCNERCKSKIFDNYILEAILDTTFEAKATIAKGGTDCIHIIAVYLHKKCKYKQEIRDK